MSERQETTLFVASADGTSMEPLPRSELRRRLEARLLRWTQQVWCPDEGKWKSAREIARLATPPQAPSSRPVPVPKVAVAGQPSVAQPRASAARVPSKVAVPAPRASVAPRASASAVRTPSAVATARSPATAPAPKAQPKAWYLRNTTFYGVGSLLLILALLGMNWLGAALPARRAVADAGLSGTAVVTAHCAFYVQPGSLVLNFERLPEGLSSEKFFDLLTALAVRNPTSTLFFAKYDGIALAKDGRVRYRLRGDAWEALARMKDEVAGRRAMMLINYLYDAHGKPVLDQKEDRMEYLHGQKEKALRDFLDTFLKLEAAKRPATPSPSDPAP